jgi:hypothetical protein
MQLTAAGEYSDATCSCSFDFTHGPTEASSRNGTGWLAASVFGQVDELGDLKSGTSIAGLPACQLRQGVFLFRFWMT